MTDLQSIFYVAGIIYIILNIIILVAVGVGMIFVFRSIKNMQRKVEEKMKFAERIIQHPEEVIGAIGASLIRMSLQNAKKLFKKRKNNNSTE